MSQSPPSSGGQFAAATASVSITCPPVDDPQHPGPRRDMLPNFLAKGTYSHNGPQLKLEFRLVKGNRSWHAPDLAVMPPGGNWANSGWFENGMGPLPPNGGGYTLVVRLLASNNGMNWDEVAKATSENLSIDAVNGVTCTV